MSERLERQNEVIIGLLARSNIGIEVIHHIVTSGKKKGKPENFVLAYNALNGSTTIGELAEIVGITQQGMASVLQTWEEEGIVYKFGTASQTRYVGLLKLPKILRKAGTSITTTKKAQRSKSARTRTASAAQPSAEPLAAPRVVDVVVQDIAAGERVPESALTVSNLEESNGTEGEAEGL